MGRKKLERPEELLQKGYCYSCKEFDEKLKEENNRPCRFRDYPDFYNMCFSYSANRAIYEYRG